MTRPGTDVASPSSTQAVGNRTHRAFRRWSVTGRRRLAPADLVLFLWAVDARWRPRPISSSRAHCAVASGRLSSRSRRSMTIVLNRTRLNCGRLGLGEPPPRAASMGAEVAICSMPLVSLRALKRQVRCEGGPRRVAVVEPIRMLEQVESAQPPDRRGALGRRLRCRAPRSGPVDSLVELGGEIWRFVDTAGLRKRVNQASGMEYYASLRTAAAIEAAEVAVVLLDAADTISRWDQRVLPRSDRSSLSLPSMSGTCSTKTATTSWSVRSVATLRATHGRRGSIFHCVKVAPSEKLAQLLRG